MGDRKSLVGRPQLPGGDPKDTIATSPIAASPIATV